MPFQGKYFPYKADPRFGCKENLRNFAAQNIEKHMTETWNVLFDNCIKDYHQTDNVDTEIQNPYPASSLEHLLYLKCWIDTVQWHLEDIIRREDIDPVEALKLKRHIDASNQHRTDVVEYIDSYFLEKFKEVTPAADASLNTESPAWAIDRLSILALKIYHMQAEVSRSDASQAHRQACQGKLDILLEQRKDLSQAIDSLLEDIAQGHKYMKAYRQMKMYNDPALNPQLYAKQAK